MKGTYLAIWKVEVSESHFPCVCQKEPVAADTESTWKQYLTDGGCQPWPLW